MLEIDKKMIDLLRNGVTLQKMRLKLEIYDSDIVKKINLLSDKGYSIHRVFNEYGVKFQILDKIVTPLQDSIEIPIGAKFSFLVISDTHLGNIYENLSLVEGVYKYANENNIHYVFHLGDMIEGCTLNNQNSQRIKRLDIHEQVDYVTKKYPKIDNINTIYILGNHDYRCLTKGIDISKIIEHRRLDMHFAGYKNSRLKIGDKVVLLQHPFMIDNTNKYDSEIRDLYVNPKFDLVLRGHTHQNGIYLNQDNSIVVSVPACYSSPSRKYPGAYEVEFTGDNVKLKSLILGDEPEIFSITNYDLKPKVKVIPTRIDKFNERLSKKNK